MVVRWWGGEQREEAQIQGLLSVVLLVPGAPIDRPSAEGQGPWTLWLYW